MATKDKTIQVCCTVVAAPSHKGAFLASFRDSDGEPIGKKWLPYSRVKQVLRGCGGFTVEGEASGEEIIIELPTWLAEKDDIAPLIRDQILDRESMDEDELEADEADDDD